MGQLYLPSSSNFFLQRISAQIEGEGEAKKDFRSNLTNWFIDSHKNK